MQKVALFRRMANREKGEGTLRVGEKTYTLAVNFHTWAFTQNALRTKKKTPSVEEITARIGEGNALAILALFWGSLQKYHDDIDSMDAAGELLQASEGKAFIALMDAMGIARPDPADIKELGLDANPPEAQTSRKRSKAGTGESSSSPLAASA